MENSGDFCPDAMRKEQCEKLMTLIEQQVTHERISREAKELSYVSGVIFFGTIVLILIFLNVVLKK